MVTTPILAGARRPTFDVNQLEAQARADGWLDADGYWTGPPGFEELLALATLVFGATDLAQAWMQEPAFGLDGQRPADLAETPQGAEQVGVFLARLERGIYT